MKSVFLFLVLLSLFSFSILLLCQPSEGFGICSILSEYQVYLSAASIHGILFFSALFFLWKGSLKSTLESIALPGDIMRNLVFSVAGFMLVMAVMLVIGLASTYLGINDQQAVYEKIIDLPIAILLFAALIAPITEELFFRAFLVPRIGIIFSSLLFGILHFSYGSLVELAGAAAIGIVLAVIFRISKSITPCLIIHMMYNMLSIFVMKVLL